jgi:lysophospholipase L1-like esterase
MKILILTDSLSLAREHEGKIISYEETYPYLLKKQFPHIDFSFTCIGGATIEILYSQLDYYKYFRPDLVILQCGIVDCAPRAFSPFERKIINKLGLVKLLKKTIYLLRKHRGYKYTSLKDFKKYSKKFKTLLEPNSNIYSIGILPASSSYEAKVPGIQKSIKKYNEILSNNFLFISTNDFPEDGFLSDFFHLNSKGHKIILGKLAYIIQQFETTKTNV